MKNNLMRVVLVLCLCAVVFAVWDKDKPASSTSLRNSNPLILGNWSALETALAQDHEFSTGGTNSGKHEVLTMEEEASAGASATNELYVQAIDGGSGQPEFAITSEDGNELQMTKDGDLYSSAGLTVTTNATFNGGITLGAGDDLIGSATSDITINTDKFTVDGATGNTVVAGTLAVTGVATLGDSSQMATDAAPTADADLANKKYVDDTPHTGGIVQVVNTQTGAVATGSTVIPFDDTIPQKTEGTQFMTLAITPTNASNKLKIDIIAFFGEDTADDSLTTMALFQDAITNAIAAVAHKTLATSNVYCYTSQKLTHYMTAGTTSEITFKIRAGNSSGGTTTFNGVVGARKLGGIMASSITITEVKI